MSNPVAGSLEPGRPRAAGLVVGFVALQILATAAFFWPLPARLGTTLPHDLVDPALNTWILWWNGQHWPLTAAWWDAPIFQPQRGALAFSETLLGLWPVAAPLQWAGLSAVQTYNLLFLASFPLCGLAMFLLVRSHTGDSPAAAVAGAAYAFSAYRLEHLAHLQVLAAFGAPFALLGLEQFRVSRRPVWLAVFGLAWMQQALTSGYWLAAATLLVAGWIVWFGRGPDRGIVGPILAGWSVAALGVLPVLQIGRAHV